jgi:murein DD-endopeptidase MepM/ murein hydrolase activator NlpD
VSQSVVARPTGNGHAVAMRTTRDVLVGVALGVGVLVYGWAQGHGAPPEAARTTAGAAPDALASSDHDALRARALRLPVVGFDRRGLRDDFEDPRIDHVHHAIDLLAPRGTPVVAVDDGVVARLLSGGRGGRSVYQLDATRSYCYYYAHLDRWAPGLREGVSLRRGDLVGFVGTTGNAPAQTPHLHFAIYKVGDDERWSDETAIDPYPLWAAPPRAAVAGPQPR